MVDRHRSEPEPVEVDLLVRFREGDANAFKQLVGTYQRRLVQFFYRLCWDRDRAEDFTQELFMKLLRGASRYRPQGRLGTYIYRVATNLWIDHYRSMQPRPRLYSLEQAAHPSEASSGRGPEAVAIDHEEKQNLRRAMESLTEPHRLVFELAVYQELPYAEVGRVLDIPVGTVKSRMHNSVRALRDLIGHQKPNDTERAGPSSASGGGCA